MNRILSPLATFLVLAACGPNSAPASGHGENPTSPTKPDHQEHHEHEEHPQAAEHNEDAPQTNEVHIDESMLRDLRVTTQAAEVRQAAEGVTVLGELGVNEDAYAEVGSSIAARVSRVLAQPGDVVAAGQVLVELDSLEVGQARAAALTTRARLGLARQVADRRRALGAEQIVPARDLQSAEAELLEAHATHQAAEATLIGLHAQRGTGSRFALTAPIAGTVIDRMALRGRMVDATQTLFAIGDLSRLWLMVHVFERDALRIKTGAEAQVTFPGLPGENLTGIVTRIGSRVDPTSRTIDVRIELDNASGVLRPGMSASARLPIGDEGEQLLAIPIEALQRQQQGWCVFIPQAESGHFELRPVGRGRDLAGAVEIVSGLRAGENVVVDGAFLLKAEADKARGGAEEHHH